jgi:TPR repeat protein
MEQYHNANLFSNSISGHNSETKIDEALLSFFYLGKCYFDGEFIEFYPLESLNLFRTCAQTFPHCFIFYCEAIDVCIEFSSARNQFLPYLEHFKSNAGQSIRLNKGVAFYFHRLCRDSDLNAVCLYGIFLFFGFGVNLNHIECKKYIWISANLKHSSSLLFLGYFFFSLFDHPKQETPPSYFFQQSAELGNSEGMNCYGKCLMEGTGIQQNLKLAAYWFQQSAELGNSDGMNYYGLCLKEGQGVQQNHELAASWFQQSAKLGNSRGMLYYGLCLKEGLGVQHNPELAAYWFQLSAESGNSTGMNFYGLCVKETLDIQQNHELAAYWFHQSAELGNSDGMVNYGVCLLNGQGVPQNESQAFSYFYEAHLLGHLFGRVYVIYCQTFGIGTLHNPRKAFKK